MIALALATTSSSGTAGFGMLLTMAVIAAAVVVALASVVRTVNLAIGFGATVSMWALGYIAMTAPGLVIGELIFVLSLGVIVAAGFYAARRGGPGASGLVIGLVCAAANLLVVGGLFGGRPSVSLEVERHGARQEIPVFLPRQSSETAEAADLGLVLERDSSRTSGLRVVAVAPASSAENSVIVPGDFVLRIDGAPATDPAQITQAVAEEALRRRETPARSAPWVIGLFLVSALLGAAGDRLGRRANGRAPSLDRGVASAITAARPPIAPAGFFAGVAAAAIFLLLITGGLVTGLEAGLAVPDWPNSFGHNMLLYPMSEMKGGVYYEHAHRLFGMLVGLTTLVLVSVVFRSDRRGSVRTLAIALLAAVITQGLLGALRVTGGFSMSEQRADHSPSLGLAIVHGVLGQGILAGMVVLAAMLSSAWRSLPGARAVIGGGTMRGFSLALVFLIVGQLILGACYRHLYVPPDGDTPAVSPAWALHGHITLAAVIMVVALMTGFRAKAFARELSLPIVPGLGRALHIVVGLQILLGVGALVVVLLRSGPAIPAWEVVVTTSHQATGAVLLSMAAVLAAWSWRLVRGTERRGAASSITA